MNIVVPCEDAAWQGRDEMAESSGALAEKSRIDHGPNPQIVALRTQLASAGHTKDLLAQTDLMTMHIHCYAPKGGENGLHAHTEEDHVFVCLQGQALFRGLDGVLPPLRKHQAIFLPKGCFYSFSNETSEPCILVRFG